MSFNVQYKIQQNGDKQNYKEHCVILLLRRVLMRKSLISNKHLSEMTFQILSFNKVMTNLLPNSDTTRHI